MFFRIDVTQRVGSTYWSTTPVLRIPASPPKPRIHLVQTMAESEQGTATLQKLWKGGRVGYLSAFEQMDA